MGGWSISSTESSISPALSTRIIGEHPRLGCSSMLPPTCVIDLHWELSSTSSSRLNPCSTSWPCFITNTKSFCSTSVRSWVITVVVLPAPLADGSENEIARSAVQRGSASSRMRTVGSLRTSNSEPLALTTRQTCTTCAEERLVTIRQAAHKLVHENNTASLLDLGP